MNDIFDIKRFGNYFLYDLRRAKNNYGLSLLLLGLTPAILLVCTVFFSLIFNGKAAVPGDEMKYMVLFISVLIVLIGAGSKLYGSLTEKRSGSDFLMLPASTLEKWASMVLMVCIVLPVLLFALLFVCDGLLGLVLPGLYGVRIFDLDFVRGLISGTMGEEVRINLPAILFLNWSESMLVFTLGAICFKRSKAAKTIFCLFVFGMLMTSLTAIVVGNIHIDAEWISSRFGDIDQAVRFLNRFLSITYALVIGCLLGGTYYRLRTLKH